VTLPAASPGLGQASRLPVRAPSRFVARRPTTTVALLHAALTAVVAVATPLASTDDYARPEQRIFIAGSFPSYDPALSASFTPRRIQKTANSPVKTHFSGQSRSHLHVYFLTQTKCAAAAILDIGAATARRHGSSHVLSRGQAAPPPALRAKSNPSGDLCKSSGTGILPAHSGAICQRNRTGWEARSTIFETFAEVSSGVPISI
jgi:hypothetical protein